MRRVRCRLYARCPLPRHYCQPLPRQASRPVATTIFPTSGVRRGIFFCCCNCAYDFCGYITLILIAGHSQRCRSHRNKHTFSSTSLFPSVAAQYGSIACALAAEGGLGLPRRLHLDGPSLNGTSSSGSAGSPTTAAATKTAPVNLLRLCSNARGSGPAMCVAKAPTKLSVQQKIELCRDADEVDEGDREENEDRDGWWSDSGDESSSTSGNTTTAEAAGREASLARRTMPPREMRDPTMPAVCAAAAASYEVPPHKVVAVCRGATSTTPAHCLRESTSLTEEDIARCRVAKAVPAEVHLEGATLGSSGGAAAERVEDGSGEGGWLSDEFVLDALVVDQFHQPVNVGDSDISIEVVSKSNQTNNKQQQQQQQLIPSSSSTSSSPPSSSSAHGYSLEQQRRRRVKSKGLSPAAVTKVEGGVANGTTRDGRVHFSAVRFLMSFLWDDDNDDNEPNAAVPSQGEPRHPGRHVVDDYGFVAEEGVERDAYHDYNNDAVPVGRDEDEAEDEGAAAWEKNDEDLRSVLGHALHRHPAAGKENTAAGASAVLRFAVGGTVLGTVRVLLAASSFPFRACKDLRRSFREKVREPKQSKAGRQAGSSARKVACKLHILILTHSNTKLAGAAAEQGRGCTGGLSPGYPRGVAPGAISGSGEGDRFVRRAS